MNDEELRDTLVPAPKSKSSRRFAYEITVIVLLVAILGLNIAQNSAWAGNLTKSRGRDKTATTSPVSVSIISPSANALVHGTVPVTVSASSTRGDMKYVLLMFDGYFMDSSNIAPFTTTLLTSQVGQGTHSIQTMAEDMNGNRAYSEKVTINITPALSTDDIEAPRGTRFVSPTDWSVVSGIVPVKVAATDNVGITRAYLYIDSDIPVAIDPATMSYDLDTSKYQPGTYITLRGEVYDAAYNHSSIPLVTVKVAN